MSSTTQTETDKPANRITIYDWAATHGIDPWILPLETRRENPLELIKTLKDGIDSLPKTQSTFRTGEFGIDGLHSGYKQPLEQLFGLRECSTTNRLRRYLNPQYMHYGHSDAKIKDADKRREFYEYFKKSPNITAKWFATHFGHTTQSFHDWLDVRGLTWSSQKKANRVLFGRSLYTITEWDTQYSQRGLSRLMPIPTHTVMTWINRYGKETEWQPPEHPEDEQWFKKHRAKEQSGGWLDE